MPTDDPYPLLSKIDSPADLRRLPATQLVALAAELRQYLIETVSQTGGHFAAGLGTVELTIALHYVFDTPHDRLVWDVGHQAYPHKILTGRREPAADHQARRTASRPSRAAAKASTTPSASATPAPRSAPRWAWRSARADRASSARVVAVIGDGAMTAGMAFEALNHAGALDADLLVILNDNDMSISRERRRAVELLRHVLSGKPTPTLREGSKKVLKRMPTVWELARRTEEHVKGMVLPGTLFEELGFNYIGPIDGHDLGALVTTLRNLRDAARARSSCTSSPARARATRRPRPTRSSGTAPARSTRPAARSVKAKSTGARPTRRSSASGCATWPSADPRLVGITPAMREGSGLVEFSQALPGSLFRRRHRRAARRDAGRRPGLRGLQARWWRSIRPSCSAPTTS